MKKENRLLKINDNFSRIEFYYDDTQPPGKKDFVVSVLVASRTFSGSYQCRFNRQKYVDFSGKVDALVEKLTTGTCEPLDVTINFHAPEDSLVIEISPLSPGKVLWRVTCRPFLHDLEVLAVKLETEANLLRAISSGIEKL